MSENVKVAVRCRPMSAAENARGDFCCIEIAESTVKYGRDQNEINNEKNFTFDHAYFTEATNDQIYNDIGEPIVSKALEGYNGTVFAYGQTGSGKTYTMMGGEGDYTSGIIPRLTMELFERIHKEKDADQNTDFLVQVSYLEIYNEEIKDLLNPKRDQKLKIRQHTKLGFYVDGLAELVVDSGPKVLNMIEQGSTLRQVAATKMNARSSRSHSVFTIKLAKKTKEEIEGIEKMTELNAKINLVDLAGSERASKTEATGARLKEGANINQSLMALGNVISALAKASSESKKEHIPYRNSTLTKLLQDSLGGNGITIMVAAISPAVFNFDETVSTLRYADRAKQIKNKLVKNEDVTQRVIRELKSEIERLRKLKEMGAGFEVGEPNDEDPELDQKLKELELLKSNDWQEKERLTVALEEERKRNMNQEISTVMKDVKSDKKAAMIKIKRLDEEKKSLASQRRKNKRKAQSKTKTLQSLMERFEVLQKNQDGKEKDGDDSELEKEEKQVFEKINQQRGEIVALKEQDKELKEQLQEVEDQLVDARTALVACQNVLDQNEKLRERIRSEQMARLEKLGAEAKEEEQAKLEEKLQADEEKIEKRMKEKVGNLKAKMQEEAKQKEAILMEKIEQLKKENSSLQNQKKTLKAKITEWEEKISESEVQAEEVEYQVEELENDVKLVEQQLKVMKSKKREEIRKCQAEKQQLEEIIEKRVEERSSKIQIENKKMHDEERFKVFSQLLNFFEEERVNMQKKYQDTVRLLESSAKDISHLQRQNAELRNKIHHAKTWEPDL